jgi:hypothetical protein
MYKLCNAGGIGVAGPHKKAPPEQGFLSAGTEII